MEGLPEKWDRAWHGLMLLSSTLPLLERPHSWTRKGYALDSRGRQVRVDDPSATRFCLVGAVLRTEHDRTGAPMPVATDPGPQTDDLQLPVAPDAQPHLALALNMLAVGSLQELHRAGLSVRVSLDSRLTPWHVPMLLGLTRRTGHAQATNALLRAIELMTRFCLDDRLPGTNATGLVEEPS